MAPWAAPAGWQYVGPDTRSDGSWWAVAFCDAVQVCVRAGRIVKALDYREPSNEAPGLWKARGERL